MAYFYFNSVKPRRKDLSIAELYQPVGQKNELKKLEILPSYMKNEEVS